MPWILIAVAVFIIFFVIIVNLFRKKRSPNYYNLFIMGVIWTVAGLLPIFIQGFNLENLSSNFLLFTGVILLIIGLANKDKWRIGGKTWDQLTPEEKKFKFIFIIILAGIVLAGFIVYLLKMEKVI